MATSFITGHHYAVGNLGSAFIGNTLSGTIHVKNAIYISKDVSYPTFKTDIDTITFSPNMIVIGGENGNIIIPLPYVLKPIKEHFIAFEFVSLDGDSPSSLISLCLEFEETSLTDIESTDLTPEPYNEITSIKINGNACGFVGDLNITSTDIFRTPTNIYLELSEQINNVSMYRNQIKITYQVPSYLEWEHMYDVTSLCSNGTTIIDSTTGFIKVKNISIPFPIFAPYTNFIDLTNVIRSNNLQIIMDYSDYMSMNGESPSSIVNNVVYESDVTVTLRTTELTNHYFTRQSDIRYTEIYRELGAYAEKVIVLYKNDNYDPRLEVTFKGIYQNIDIEYFDESSLENFIVDSQARANPIFKEDNTFTGLELNEEDSTIKPGDSIIYGSNHELKFNTDEGYYGSLITCKEIRIYMGARNVTDDTSIVEFDEMHPLNLKLYHVIDDLRFLIRLYKVAKIIFTGATLTTTLEKLNEIYIEERGEHSYRLHITDVEPDTQEIDFSYRPIGNKKFVGFGINGRLWLGIGESAKLTDVDLSPLLNANNELNLEPIIQDIPVPTGFNLNLYKLKCENTLVDKTDYIELVSTLSGALRDSCSVTSPTITIEYSQVPDFNYVYIPQLHRYFFVTEITSVRKDIWNISLHCDVLMTYHVGIKGQNAMVARNEYEFNNLLEDTERVRVNKPTYEVIDINYAIGNKLLDSGLNSDLTDELEFAVVMGYTTGGH